MRVIMSCGGTGGHIYPALAIADTIKMKNPDAEIMFIGTLKGMENDIVPAHGYSIKSIPASGFKRKKIWKNFRTVKDAVEGYSQAKAIIKGFAPDMVIGTGGYVCGPVVRAAHKLGIRTAIHEQNAFPGMANKLLSKYVDKIFLSFEEAGKYFNRDEVTYLTGNPLRRGFVLGDRDASRKKLNIGANELVVLCFGGSLGAPRINRLMVSMIARFNGSKDISIFFVTGKTHYKEIKKTLGNEVGALKDNIRLFEYINNMPEYMSAADIIVSRAGALTIAELTASGKPAILIPSPYVTGNHQYFNAKVMADRGAALLVEEKNLDDDEIIDSVIKMKSDAEILEKMRENSLSLAKTDAAEKIYDQIKEFLPVQ